MPDSYDVVIVGAGPAGLAAARRASECGASVAMVDDNPQPGGQIWRGEQHQAPGVCLSSTRVIAAPEPGVLTLDTDSEIRYRSLILATGARERFLPFPGWTLPNVMGAGGLQALAKSGMPIRGKKVVVAGTGPLLLAVAKYLRAHGADLRLVAEQTTRAALFRFALGLAGHPSKLFQAAQLRIVPMTSCWPIAADGNGQLASVTLYRHGKTWRVPCDYLACAFGLAPNTELAALLGCRLGDQGVTVDDFQQTNVPGIYAAGEVTGIGGLDLSEVEGEIAGYAAAGKPDAARPLLAARERHRRFAAALDRAFQLREELKSLAQDETIVCRCEDVTFERIRARAGWRDAKLQTRCGMGPCQGRVCGPAVEFLLGWKSESVRPPVFPASIASLSGPKCPRP
jgi:NADPH-dependent 2,4-dienoyl-CoA reductase/sulfur reductase-like enzyme